MRTCGRWGILAVTVVIVLLAAGPAAGEEPETAGGQASAAVGEKPMIAGNQASEITVEKLPSMTVLALPMTGSYDQHGQAIMQVVTQAASTGIIRGAPFGVYHSDPEKTPEASLRWDICVPVAADAKAGPPFEVRKLPAMEAAVVTCTGPYEGTSPCYGALTAWLAKSDYQLGGPVQEHWLSDTRSVPPEKCVARILFPIVRKQP